MSVPIRRKYMICRALVAKVPFQLAPKAPLSTSLGILLSRTSWRRQTDHLYSVNGMFVLKAMVEWWIRRTSLMQPLR